MTFCFDENFPEYLTEAIRLFGYNVEHVVPHFGKGTDDTLLFPELARRGWDWVSHDKGVTRKPHERAAMRGAGIGAFILTGRAQRSPQQMMIFVLQHIDEMVRLAERTHRPFIYGLSDRPKIQRLD